MKLEFDLYIRDPKELFVFDKQTYDPFDDDSLGESGLDYLGARMLGFWLHAPRDASMVRFS